MFGFSPNLVHFQQLQFGGSTSNLFLKIYSSVPIGYFFLTIFFLLCCSARQILGKMFWGFAKILIFSKVILLPLRKCPSRVWFSDIITIKKICSEYILGVFSMKVMYFGGLPWWLSGKRICLAMQKAWVQSLVWDDPTCCRATKPERHNYWACSPQPGSRNCRTCSLQPGSHNYWSPSVLESVLQKKRSHYKKKPLHRNQRVAVTCHNWRKAWTAIKTQGSQKVNK